VPKGRDGKKGRISDGNLVEKWEPAYSAGDPPPPPPPANKDERPNRFAYLQKPALDSVYVTFRRPEEDRNKYRRRIYWSLITLLQDTPNGREMRVEIKWKKQTGKGYGPIYW
jgi:hypothetical protein